ncbi:MAG: phosphatidate cytidylyltransferase [Candidatus Auribacterota bacterium]|nr:phosphatidate cytidylyltransferase [Candidatus Auribacterota bacterium]
MFIKRTVSTMFLVPIFISAVIYSRGSLSFLVLILTNLLVAFGLLDFMYITNRTGSKLLRTYGLITGLILHTILFFAYFFGYNPEQFIVPATVIILLGMFLLQLIRQDIHLSIHGICTTITGILYVVWLFSYMIRINYIREPDGRWLIFMLLLVTKSGDIFAYLIGSVFGRHKLIPKISPGKTIEGSIGGILGSICVSILFSMVAPLPEQIVENAWLIGLFLGVFGQLGDLVESMLKRNGAVKDSGEYIPGMGGVLDLLDSVLFTAPIMYYYIQFGMRIS